MAAQRRSKKDEKGFSMKKRIASIVCAAMLMLALPALAWAAPSPSVINGSGTASNGATMTITANGSGQIAVEGTSDTASNVPTGANVYASFHVYKVGEVNIDGTITLTFNVGAANAGRTATVYVQHDDGATEVLSAVVDASGNITVTVDRLSVFSIVLGDQAAGATADKSAKSPATGVDMGVVAGGSAVALCGAAVVAVALRKKVTE